MAADEFNSLGGYSVGIPPVPVIDANGNVVTNVLATTGNVAAGNVYAGNYFYANGQPFTGGGEPVGANTTVQYNNDGAFGGSDNFTFDNTTDTVTIPNLTVTGLSDLGPVGNITITGGGSGYVLSTDGSGSLSWLPPGSGTSGISNGNSNLYVTTSGGNITASVGGNSNVFVITGNGVVVNGNITATNIIGNISGNANFAVTAGTVTTNAQPNITSVGTLSNLSVTGNVTAGNVKTDHLLYANGDPYAFTTNAAGINTQVQFNNANAFGASANFTFNNSTNTLSVTNITANGAGLTSLTGANVTGQVSFAAVANSIAISNVVGIGNIASSNYDGNASNVLHGDGTWSADQTNYGNSNVVSLLNAFGSNNLVTTGNVTAGKLSGNGASISSITGANVTGAVPYATVANSVAGANVSGAVNLANYASVANSVAGANVTGAVANATYANTAGNANTAGTVTTNAQPNITSVGTLTSLTVAGNILPNANVTYNLGSSTQRWRDLYLAGNTIDLNGSTISSDANGITLTNPLGGTFTVVGTGAANTASINNGNSSIIIQPNSEIDFNVTGTSNIVVVSSNGITTSANANITGNLTAGNISTGGVVSATGNVSGGNITTVGVVSATGNITGGNLTTANGVYSATANITGNLTSGNANLGNVATANYFVGNGSSLSSITGANVTGTVANATYAVSAGSATTATSATTAGTVTTASQPNITSVGTLSSLNVSGTGSFGANVNLNNQWINNVGYPSLNTDVATKAYVDTMVSSGIAYHQPVAVATTTTLAIATSGTTAYVQPNGAGNGIGAYISTTGTYTNIDGQAVNSVGTRILVKNEANAAWNGVYTYANSTAIIRSSDTDEYGPDNTEQLSLNDYFFVQTGSVNAGIAYIVSAPSGTITFGTSNIVFAEFSSSQTYNAGTGLTLTGTTFSVNANQSQVTNVGTLGNLTVTGNATAGNVYANSGTIGASLLTGTLTTADQPNISNVGTLGNLTVTANITAGNVYANSGTIGASLVAGTLTTASQPNISTVGSLTGLTVSNASGVVDFANTANVSLGAVGNVHITGGSSGYVLQTDGSGTLSWAAQSVGGGSNISNGTSNVNIASSGGNVTTSVGGNANILTVTGTGANISGTLNVTGLVTVPNTAGGATAIAMGSPTQGNLISNAVTLTSSSSVSNAIAQLNLVLGKLVPPAPSNFPASQSITVASLSTYRMANYTQTDNTPGANKSVAGGTTVTTVRRASSYSVNTITNAGPGDSGTITVLLNGSNAGSRTLTTNLDGNGTYSNLIITNNYDYHTVNANIQAGFWSVFTSQASGTVTEGWNEVYIADSATSNTNTYSWFYDSSNPGTPAFSSLSISPPGSPSYTYSSTVPHYNNTNIFTLTANVNKLSGNMYPTSDNFVTGTAGGAFGTPGSVTYAAAGVTTPLAQNLYVSSGNASISTTSTIISGFGASSTGPSLSSNNSYNSNTQAFTTTLGANVLYKTGTVSSASVIEEANVYVGSTIGTGSGLAFRIINPGSANTPTYTGSEAAFNSQTSTLQTYDATVVANILKHDQTNYSTGYLPVGPDLSSGRSGSQFFTFKIVRTSVSKFDVKWTGNIAGLWVALPGSTIDTTSTANGWIDMSVAYAGAGVPGAGVGGNGSNGCALGGIAPLNSSQTNKSVTATFGTVSSSSTATNEIYIRVKLTSGQSVTALSLQTASN